MGRYFTTRYLVTFQHFCLFIINNKLRLSGHQPNSKYARDLFISAEPERLYFLETLSLLDCIFTNMYQFSYLTYIRVGDDISPKSIMYLKTGTSLNEAYAKVKLTSTK